MRSAAACVLLSLLVSACASGGGDPPPADPGAPPSADLAATDEPLQPGDQVRVTFSQERELSGEFPVDETFDVALPLIGRTNVRGVPGPTLRDSLSRALEGQIRNQTVQVTLLRRVRVLGDVQRPGLYLIDNSMTLVDAIALAGGTTQQGKLDGVDIVRDGVIVAEDLPSTALVGSYVRSGDQIMVPKTSWLSRNAAWVIGGTVTTAAIVITSILTSD